MSAASVVASAAFFAWVTVDFALATVVLADDTVALVDSWRRMRPTSDSPRLTRSE